MEYVDVAVIGGGQSGLAAAHVLRQRGLVPVVLEAAGRAAGSWPGFYDSLTLFSPARYSAMPDLPFGGDGDRYPHRDEVVDYLTRYANRLDAEIRTHTRVESVESDGGGYTLRTTDGRSLGAVGIVAATGAFGNPLKLELPGQRGFTGELLHVADYRNPAPYAGKRVVVVGGGNSAVQIGYELSEWATRAPVRFLPQLRGGKDLHHLRARGRRRVRPSARRSRRRRPGGRRGGFARVG
ncbi:hypothetical protein GCM10027074_74990 [Streptomyces deserti]